MGTLPPTTTRLREPDVVPYFLWDLKMTVAQAKRVLSGSDRKARLAVITRLLREANTRDVWLFVDWNDIEDAWPEIEHHLGRARAVWQLMREHRASHRERAR